MTTDTPEPEKHCCMCSGTCAHIVNGVQPRCEAHDDIPPAEQLDPREPGFRAVLQAVEDMEKAAAAGNSRTVSKGEVVKWIKFELGEGEGRNG